MEIEEVRNTNPNRVKGYIIKHNVAIHVSNDELKDVRNDSRALTNFILDCIKTKYELWKYDDFSFGNTLSSCFGYTFHVNLLTRKKGEEKKISWLSTFIRGDHPEYGELTMYVFAKDQKAVIEHLKSCYGEDVKIISIK